MVLDTFHTINVDDVACTAHSARHSIYYCFPASLCPVHVVSLDLDKNKKRGIQIMNNMHEVGPTN